MGAPVPHRLSSCSLFNSRSGKSGQRAMRTTRLEAWMQEEPPIPLAAYGLAQTTGRGTQPGIANFDETWEKAVRR